MSIARGLLCGHAAALVFGLAGMLIAMPHPELWAGNPLGGQVYAFGMTYSGSLHMVLGALAMFAFGTTTLGWRKTAIFLLCACAISLSAELVGTGTGYPFGNYAYTAGLGVKILGRVPFSIPLSWFYMGFAAYLLGARLSGNHRWLAVALGAYLLTAWDLVLDPAMASASLPIQFWQWHQAGAYFGMPIQNFAGWTATGAAFMAVATALWRQPSVAAVRQAWFPLAVYGLNLAFAMLLSGHAALWQPILIALTLAVLPLLVLATRGRFTWGGTSPLAANPA